MTDSGRIPWIGLLLLLGGCAATDDDRGERNERPVASRGEVSMNIVSSGSYGKLASDLESERRDPFVEVAENRNELTRLWNLHIADAPAPEISFDDSIVVFLLVPARPTGGYGVEPKDASISNGTLEIEATVREPGQGAIVTQAFTAPYAVIRLEGAGEVEHVVWTSQGRAVASKRSPFHR